ncbi:family 43 glycosylhydrolase [Pontiellaceae bacterium B12227]|nr:family 43 glycosylhydrolase [Pontiellaceae bacterium B12227]
MKEQKRKPFIVLALVIAIMLGMDAAAVNNPISYNTEITDCDVIKYNGEYYITGNWLSGDMLRSRDLESWGEQRHIFSWSNTWYTANDPAEPDRDIHAGHIRYLNGTFHFYTQLGNKITHAVSDKVWGPYVEASDSGFTQHIDAESFLDDDGSLYFYTTRWSGTGENYNYVQTMSDAWTLTGSPTYQISASLDWELSSANGINEGPKVIKYRNQYYMLYAANTTSNPDYSIGCVQSDTPTGFSNALKYSEPVCARATPVEGRDEIAYIGQPWVVDGPNGFEKWMGYFGKTDSDGRVQRIDRMHFFDRTLFVDGPTDRYTPGYHPGPAKPQLLNLFHVADGSLPVADWTEQTTGTWSIENEEAHQGDQDAWALCTVNRDAAANYLIEANVKFTEAQDAEDKAGILAYYADANNWVIVGLDRSSGYGADGWYCHVKEGGVNTIYGGGYAGSIDYSVYHKIRVTKSAGQFDIRIDDMIPPGHSAISTALTGAGLPGIYTDHAAAAFDGIIYTIGWDEYDSGISGWGAAESGTPSTGSWSVDTNGITMAAGTGYTFKGDLMAEYEFATQVYKEGLVEGSMGIYAVAIDDDNYVTATIDLATDELVVAGLKDGIALSELRVSVDDKTDYNLRAVKLADQVIFFVDGVEMLTLNKTYGAAQVGLYVEGMSARYNGLMAYRTEPEVLPAPWTDVTDVGAVGFPGTADYLDETLYMEASGSDIWGTADEFTFLHAGVSGDWELSARIVNRDESHYWAKAGLMFRNNVADDSGMVMLCATGTDEGIGRVQLNWREDGGSAANSGSITNLTYPIWLKITRAESLVTGYCSTNGLDWMTVGSVTPDLNLNGQLGFGLTANNNDRIATAVFDRIAHDATLTTSADVYAVNGSGEIRSFTGASSGSIPIEGNTFSGGSLVTTVASYGSYLGFTQVPDGTVYGVNAAGGVDSWSSIYSWLAGDSPTVESSGVYGADGIHGCSYDGNTGGFYVVYEGGGVDGHVGEYATLSDFINNVNATVSASVYSGNINNWWYPGTDSGGNSRYYQSTGGGNLQGQLTLADYIANSANRTVYSPNGSFSGVGAVFAATAVMSSPPELLPPTDLVATATASQEITLTWTAATNALGYNIYRSTTSGSYGAPFTNVSPGSAVSFTDSGLENFATYYYKMTSVALAADSDDSEEVSVLVLQDPAGTNAPAGPIVVLTVSGSRISLDWPDNTEPDFQDYAVYRSETPGAGTGGTLLASGLTLSEYRQNELPVGVTYYYTVIAQDDNGNQGFDAEVSGAAVAPLASDEANIYLIGTAGQIYGFGSFDGDDDISIVGQGTLANGIPVGSHSNGTYQGFAAVPSGEIYGIDAAGEVTSWSSLSSFVAGDAPAVLSSGAPYSGSSEINDLGFDPDTGGFYVTRAADPYSGDLIRYPDLASLLVNSIDSNLVTAAALPGNMVNMYYPGEDAPGNYNGNTAGANFFSISGAGALEGWQTAADISGGVYAATYRRGTFTSGGTIAGGFALVNSAPASAVGDATVSQLDATTLEIEWMAEQHALYKLQSRDDLLSGDWADIEDSILWSTSDAPAVLDATISTNQAQFFRLISE